MPVSRHAAQALAVNPFLEPPDCSFHLFPIYLVPGRRQLTGLFNEYRFHRLTSPVMWASHVLPYRQDPPEVSPPFGSSICSIPAITAKHSLSPASFTPSVVPLACAWATTFAHGTGGAYHVPLDRQLCAFRGFLSPGHATNDEMAMRQRHSLMAYLFGHGASQSCGSLAATCAVLM